MAELSRTGAASGTGSKVAVRKRSTKIDMTPMVDLAFLLLTFFILTTTLTRQTVMQLSMPERATNPDRLHMLKEKNAFSVVLAESNKIYWWIGLDAPATPTNYSRAGIRKILLDRSRENHDLMVLIKPMANARYENVVDILDEVEIASITRYAIVDFTEEDKAKIPR